MLIKGVSKEEIENHLKGKGEYVQIDYLNRFIATGPHVLMKIYAYSKLAELYERKKSYGELGKTYESIAVFSINQQDKIKNFMKAAESYVKDGSFERADVALRKSMTEAKESERAMLYVKLKEFYKQEAEKFEKEMKRAQAAKIYEKMLLMRILDSEKEEIRKKLINLYEKLGKFREKALLEKRKYLN
jgi:hypothetical protein